MVLGWRWDGNRAGMEPRWGWIQGQGGDGARMELGSGWRWSHVGVWTQQWAWERQDGLIRG